MIHMSTMHSSVSFRKLTKLANYLHFLIPECCHHRKMKMCAMSRHSLTLLLFRFWQDNLFSVFLNRPIRTSHVNGIIRYVAFHVWLLLRSVHVVMNISNSMFDYWIIINFKGISQVVHSSFNGHLGCFLFLAIMNNTTLNISKCICLFEDIFHSIFYFIG